MNLKAKLCILKNYTLLLLGPSPFEHWLERYLCFTVESLCFSVFAIRSPFVYLLLSLLCFPLPHPAAAVWPCAPLLPALRRSGLCHVPSRPLPRRFPPSRWLLPARPRCAPPARADPRRRSPSQSLPRHLLPSDVPRVMPQLHRRLPSRELACPCASTSRSFCPSTAAIDTHAVDAPAPATARSQLVPEPTHILEPLSHSIVRYTHTFSFCSFAPTATSH
jgi:hypothetical protein